MRRMQTTAGTKDIAYVALSICFRGEPTTLNYKMKESTVATYLKEKFPDVTWRCDKQIEDGCSRRRFDLFLDMGSHVVIVEVDENKHDTYNCTC